MHLGTHLQANTRRSAMAEQQGQNVMRRKLVIIGDGACGKTSLLSVFTLGYFPTVSWIAEGFGKWKVLTALSIMYRQSLKTT